MTGGEPVSDEEIIARERRRLRNTGRIIVAIIALAAAGDLLLFFDGMSGALPGIGISAQGVRLFLVAGLLAAVIGLAWVSWRGRQAQARSERIVRRQIDDHQALGGLGLAVLLILLLEFATRASEGARPPFFFIALVLFAAFTFFSPRARRSGIARLLDDELTRALRGKSVLVGYLAAMAMLSGLYLTIFYSPALAMQAGPFLLVAGVAVPVLYFLFLQWQAGRGG